MTCDPLTGAPYFVVNHSNGDDTEAVTAGQEAVSWTVVTDRHVDMPPAASSVVAALHELISITREPCLDVEFGTTADGEVIVFQVRRITTLPSSEHSPKKRARHFTESLDRAVAHYQLAQRHAEHFDLGPSLLGVMPDWNPAELIGLKPRPLAFSLYDSIVTSEAWAVGRARLGYKNLRAVPLMHQVGGTPYILVAASLFSFVPDAVTDQTARRIVEVAQRRLRNAPELHDKVEFAIMPTCYKPSLAGDEWRSRFREVSDGDWRTYTTELLRLTNRAIADERVVSSAMQRTVNLESGVERIRSGVFESDETVDALALLRFARVSGTELFSEVARAAFIATDIIADLERLGSVPPGFLDATVASASTVGAQLVEDRLALSSEAFLQRHGHVRPGTYDVTVPRYDSVSAHYFEGDTPTNASVSREAEVTLPEGLDAVLQDAGYSFSWSEFLAFARKAIALREEVKHSFTKLLSDAMEIFVRFGSRFDLDREDVSFLTLTDLTWAGEHPSQTGRLLAAAVKRNRKEWKRDLPVRLPELLCGAEDVLFSEESVSQPTYVTQLRVEATVATPTSPSLQGTIVFAERADPGYDWLFTHDIAGFVTRFGGENSHMAIRARELGIPAVIGAGSRFERWAMANRLVIDGRIRSVEIVA